MDEDDKQKIFLVNRNKNYGGTMSQEVSTKKSKISEEKWNFKKNILILFHSHYKYSVTALNFLW